MNLRIVAIWFAVAALTLGVMGITSAIFEQVAHAQGCETAGRAIPDSEHAKIGKQKVLENCQRGDQ